MGTEEFHDKAEELKGKAKQAVADVTDDQRLSAEGEAEEAKATARQDVRSAAEALRDGSQTEADFRRGSRFGAAVAHGRPRLHPVQCCPVQAPAPALRESRAVA